MLRPWTVSKSCITYKDKWLKVRSDTCITKKGKEINPYHVIEYPNWIIIVAITLDFKMVLVRQYRHGVKEILLELPCGVVEKDDLGLENAARRELEEETGFRSMSVWNIGSYYANPANQNNKIGSVLAFPVKKEAVTRFDPNEEIEVVLEDFVDFLNGIHSREFQLQAFHVAGLFSAVSFVLSGQFPELADLRKKLLCEFNWLKSIDNNPLS